MLVRPSTLGLLTLALAGVLLAMLSLPPATPESASAQTVALASLTDEPDELGQPDRALEPVTELAAARAVLASNVDEPAPPATEKKTSLDEKPKGWRIARVKAGRTISLHQRPRGRVVAKVGARTEFGSKRVFAIVATRGRWLGVTSVERPNGKLAWIDAEDGGLSFSRTQVSIRADLSDRTLKLRVGRKTVASMRVAIGRPGSTTPTGRFQVTDKLSGDRYGPYYGCCILALSATQPNLPAGWKGGNRMAIHGTNAPGAIGKAASAGCLRGSDRDMKLLMRRAPVGTPVFIDA